MLRGKRHSRGRLHYHTGDLYEGDWSDDRRSGQGKLTIKSEGVLIEGLFSEDEIVEGRLTDKQENRY